MNQQKMTARDRYFNQRINRKAINEKVDHALKLVNELEHFDVDLVGGVFQELTVSELNAANTEIAKELCRQNSAHNRSTGRLLALTNKLFDLGFPINFTVR